MIGSTRCAVAWTAARAAMAKESCVIVNGRAQPVEAVELSVESAMAGPAAVCGLGRDSGRH